MDFVTGNIDQDFKFECDDNCEMSTFIECGDLIKDKLIAKHPIAELSRKKALRYSASSFKINSMLTAVKFIWIKISTISVHIVYPKRCLNKLGE
jgi:hypothetical protein